MALTFWSQGHDLFLDAVDAPLARLRGGHDEFLVAPRPGLDRCQ
jgi:hypothetical protein